MIHISLSLLQTAEDRDFDLWRSLDTPLTSTSSRPLITVYFESGRASYRILYF